LTITNGYATLNEYKAWIAARGLAGSVGTDASDDTVIELLIESVSRYIDREAGRKFWKDSADVTRYFQAKDNYTVFVGDLAAAPTTVSVDLLNDRDYTDLAATDVYELSPANAAADGMPYHYINIIETSGYYFTTSRRGVKVVAKFGFPSVPMDIKEACLSTVQAINGLRSGQASNGKITVTAAGIVIRPEEVPIFALGIIKKYRSMV